jgi:ribosome-associated heat shock protein Hsp15
LVYARFVKHRSDASELINAGSVRLNKLRISRGSQMIKPQDVLTIVLQNRVRVVKVVASAEKRGPANTAQKLYEELFAASEKEDATPPSLC